jgi:TonB family protein
VSSIGTLKRTRDHLRERRSRKRQSVLAELGELVVVTLGSERGLLLNLSAGGISVQAQNRLAPGIHLPVQFLLPLSEACVNPTCEVMWTNDNCEVGLRFQQSAESERRALEDWMAGHGAEPAEVLADAAPSGVAGAPADGEDPASSAYADLTAAMQRLMPPKPPTSHAAADEPPAAIQPVAQEDFLLRVVAQACSLTEADGAALVLRGEEGIVCRASAGNAPAVGSRLRPGSGLSGECFRLGQVVRCDDAENDSRVNSAVAQRLQSRSILIAPIQEEGATRGVLQVLSSRPFAFNAAHIATLEHLAGLVGSFLAAEEKAQPSDLAPELLVEAPPAAPFELPQPAVEPAVEERAQGPDLAPELPGEAPPAAPVEPAQSAAEPEVEERAQGADLAPGLPGEAPPAAPVEPAQSAADGADAPTGQLTPEEPVGEAAQAPEIAWIAPASDGPPITVAEGVWNSKANLRRYGALIGGLGLLTVASLAMLYVPRPNRAAQPAGSLQQAKSMPLPTQALAASRPQATENAREVGKSPPTRPIAVPLHQDAGAQSPRGTAKQRPRPATPISPAPVVKLHSRTAAGNDPAPSLQQLPPTLDKGDGGKPAAIAAILGPPTPAPVLIAPPSPLPVSEVVRGRAISQPKPVYPQAALRARVEGSVALAATIGTDGRIKKLQVVKGDARLAEAALDAVKKWRYQPSYLNGVPVEIDGTITLNFKLP